MELKKYPLFIQVEFIYIKNIYIYTFIFAYFLQKYLHEKVHAVILYKLVK